MTKHQHYKISNSGVVIYNAKARKIVYAKTGGRCWYCGVFLETHRIMSMDHVKPQSKGGSHDLHNIVPACRTCNCSKHDRDLESYRKICRLNSANWPIKFSQSQIAFLEEDLGLSLPLPDTFVFYGEREESKREDYL